MSVAPSTVVEDLRASFERWANDGIVSRAVAGVALAACSAFPVALLALRSQVSSGFSFRFLVWNLFLAWVPLGFALLAEWGWRRRQRRLVQSAALFCWFVFFPNAPYIVTDVVHLKASSAEPTGSPLWFDALILFSMGFAGLVVGFVSLRMVQLIISSTWSRVAGWAVSLGVLAISGFGIYLGRFARYNSWDILTRPRTILYDVSDVALEPLSNQRTIGISLLFAAFLVVTYVAMLAVGQLSLPGRVPRPRDEN